MRPPNFLPSVGAATLLRGRRLLTTMLLRYAYLAWKRLGLKRFQADARGAREFQHRALLKKIRRNANSDFGRDHGFANIRTVADFRRRQPIAGYDEHHPYIERVLDGDVTALFAPGTQILMFAMTSGTTGTPKRLPITEELFEEYKSGWKIWGAGVYGDHLDLMNKQTLQLSSDWQQFRAPSGVPCGQISGLAATTRPWIAQSMFLLPGRVSQIHDPAAKHYTSLRFALARTRHRHDHHGESEHADRICPAGRSRQGIVDPRYPRRHAVVRRAASTFAGRSRGGSCAAIRSGRGSSIGSRRSTARCCRSTRGRTVGARGVDGRLGQRVFVAAAGAVWRRASSRPRPVGERRSDDDSARRRHVGRPARFLSSLLRVHSGRGARQPVPTVLEGHELEGGHDYYIVMTTSGGLYRYDIHDVVRCVGFEGQAPLIEFLNKGKNFSNLTGEKLSEHQAIRAVKKSFADLELPIDTFTLAPVMEEQPRYVLLVEPPAHHGRAAELAHRVQANLAAVNEEYGDKCGSGRLLPVQVREVAQRHVERVAARADRRPRQLRGIQTPVPGRRRQFRRRGSHI